MIDILEVTKRIQKLLEEQLWYGKLITEIPQKTEQIKFGNALINRAVGIHMSLENTQEKEIFEQLLTEIDVLTLSDYQHLVNKCYVKLRKEYPNIKTIYIIPLLKTKDSDSMNVKSGLFVSYLFNTYQFSLINEIEGFSNVKICIKRYLDNQDVEKIQNNQDSLIVFVDDFVGTGRSVKTAYKSYEENKTFENLDWKKRTCVLSLSILDIGLNMLENDDVNVIFGIKHSSIPAKYRDNDVRLTDIKELIRKTSKKNGVGKQYTYGYGECLSTIITIRTPNNNIPLLWSNKLKKSKALFVRNE